MYDEHVTIRTVNQVPWSDTETVFGTRGDPAGCWCQFFKMTDSQWRDGDRARCAADLRARVEHNAVAPGLVAYLDGEPVGWVAVEPRPRYPQLFRGKAVSSGSSEPPDDESVWAISCFLVGTGYRRRGLAQHLMVAAVSLFAAAGFTLDSRPIPGRAPMSLHS
jgi:ribosomal protein S18 acetylase RimI-like enzyme